MMNTSACDDNSSSGLNLEQTNLNEEKQLSRHNLQQVIDSLIALGMLDAAEAVRERMTEAMLPVDPQTAGTLHPLTCVNNMGSKLSEASTEKNRDHEENEYEYDVKQNEDETEKIQKLNASKSNTFENVSSICESKNEQTNVSTNGTTSTPGKELRQIRSLLRTEEDILKFRQNLLLIITEDPSIEQQFATTTEGTNPNTTTLFTPSLIELIQQWVHRQLPQIVSSQERHEYKSHKEIKVKKRRIHSLASSRDVDLDADALIDGLVKASLAYLPFFSEHERPRSSVYLRTIIECYWRRELLIAWCGCVMSPALLTLTSSQDDKKEKGESPKSDSTPIVSSVFSQLDDIFSNNHIATFSYSSSLNGDAQPLHCRSADHPHAAQEALFILLKQYKSSVNRLMQTVVNEYKQAIDEVRDGEVQCKEIIREKEQVKGKKRNKKNEQQESAFDSLSSVEQLRARLHVIIADICHRYYVMIGALCTTARASQTLSTYRQSFKNQGDHHRSRQESHTHGNTVQVHDSNNECIHSLFDDALEFLLEVEEKENSTELTGDCESSNTHKDEGSDNCKKKNISVVEDEIHVPCYQAAADVICTAIAEHMLKTFLMHIVPNITFVLGTNRLNGATVAGNTCGLIPQSYRPLQRCIFSFIFSFFFGFDSGGNKKEIIGRGSNSDLMTIGCTSTVREATVLPLVYRMLLLPHNNDTVSTNTTTDYHHSGTPTNHIITAITYLVAVCNDLLQTDHQYSSTTPTLSFDDAKIKTSEHLLISSSSPTPVKLVTSNWQQQYYLSMCDAIMMVLGNYTNPFSAVSERDEEAPANFSNVLGETKVRNKKEKKKRGRESYFSNPYPSFTTTPNQQVLVSPPAPYNLHTVLSKAEMIENGKSCTITSDANEAESNDAAADLSHSNAAKTYKSSTIRHHEPLFVSSICDGKYIVVVSNGPQLTPNKIYGPLISKHIAAMSTVTLYDSHTNHPVAVLPLVEQDVVRGGQVNHDTKKAVQTSSSSRGVQRSQRRQSNNNRIKRCESTESISETNQFPNTATAASRIFGTGTFEKKHGPICCRYIASNGVVRSETVMVSDTQEGDKNQQKTRTCSVGYCAQVSESPEFAVPLMEPQDNEDDTDKNATESNSSQGHEITLVTSRFLMVTAGPFEVYKGKRKRGISGRPSNAKIDCVGDYLSSEESNDSPASRVCWVNSSESDSLTESVDDVNDTHQDQTRDSLRTRNTSSVIKRSVPLQEPLLQNRPATRRGRKNKIKIRKQKSHESNSSSDDHNEEEPYYLPSKIAIFDLFSLLSTTRNKTQQHIALQPVKALFPTATHRPYFRPLALDTVIDNSDTVQSMKMSSSLQIYNRLLSKPRKFQYFREALGSSIYLSGDLATIDPVLALMIDDRKGNRRQPLAKFSTVMDSSVWVFDKSLRWMWWHWRYNQDKLQKEEGKASSAASREDIPQYNKCTTYKGCSKETNVAQQVPPLLNCKDRGVMWSSLEAEWRYHLNHLEGQTEKSQISLPRQSLEESDEVNNNNSSLLSNTTCCLFTCLQCLTATDYTILRWLPLSGILLQNITVPYATRAVTFTPYKGGSIVVLDEHNDLSFFSVYNYHRNINYMEMVSVERSRRRKEGKERRQIAREAQRLVAREAAGGESDSAARLASQLLIRSRRGGGWWTKDSVFPPSTAPRLTLNSNWINWDSKRFGSRGENYDIGNSKVSQRRDEAVATFVEILASVRNKAGKEIKKRKRDSSQSSRSSDFVLPPNTILSNTDPFGLSTFDPTPAETAQFVQQLGQHWQEETTDKRDGQQQILYHHTDCIPTTVSAEGLLPVVSNVGVHSVCTTVNRSLQHGASHKACKDKKQLSSASSENKRRYYSITQSYFLLSTATMDVISINERMRARAVLLNNILSSYTAWNERQRDIRRNGATVPKAFFRRLTVPSSTQCTPEMGVCDHWNYRDRERIEGRSINCQQQYNYNTQRSPSVLWSAAPSVRWLSLEETHLGQRILRYELMDKHEEFNEERREERKKGAEGKMESEGEKFMKMMKVISWNKRTNHQGKQLAVHGPTSGQKVRDSGSKREDDSNDCQLHNTATEEQRGNHNGNNNSSRSRGLSYFGFNFIRKLFGVSDNSEVGAVEKDTCAVRTPRSNGKECNNGRDPPVFWQKKFPHSLSQRCLSEVTLLDDVKDSACIIEDKAICLSSPIEEMRRMKEGCENGEKYTVDGDMDTFNSHDIMRIDGDGCATDHNWSEEGIAYDPFIRLVLSFGVLFHNRQDMAHALMHETKQLCVPKRLKKPGRGRDDRQWTDGSDDDSNAVDGEDGEIEVDASVHIAQRHRAKVLSIFGASSMEEWSLLNISVSTEMNGTSNDNGRFIAMTAVLRTTRTEYLETMRMMPAQPLRGYYGVFVLDMNNLQLVSFFPVCDVLPSLKGISKVTASRHNLDDPLLSVWPRLPTDGSQPTVEETARDETEDNNISDEGPLACVLLSVFDSGRKVHSSVRCNNNNTVRDGNDRNKARKRSVNRSKSYSVKKHNPQSMQPILTSCRQYAESQQRQVLKQLVNKLTVREDKSSDDETDALPEELNTEMTDEVQLTRQCTAISDILLSIERDDSNVMTLPITAKDRYNERSLLQNESISANNNSAVDFGGFGREVLYRLPVTIVTITSPCSNIQTPTFNDNTLLRVFVGTLDDTTIQYDGYTGAVVEEYTPGPVSGIGVLPPTHSTKWDQDNKDTSNVSTPKELGATNGGESNDNRLVIPLHVDDWRRLWGSRDLVKIEEMTRNATEFGDKNKDNKGEERKNVKERNSLNKKQQSRLEVPCNDNGRLGYPYGKNTNGRNSSSTSPVVAYIGEPECIARGNGDFPLMEPLLGPLHSVEELLHIAVVSSSYDPNIRRKIINVADNYPVANSSADSHSANILSASVGLAQHLFTAVITGGNSEPGITAVLQRLLNDVMTGSGKDENCNRSFTVHRRELYTLLTSVVSCLLPSHGIYRSHHLAGTGRSSPYFISDYSCTNSGGSDSAVISHQPQQPIHDCDVVTLALKLLFRDPLPHVINDYQQACKHEYYGNKKLAQLKSEEEKACTKEKRNVDVETSDNSGKEHNKYPHIISSTITRHITVCGSDTDDNDRVIINSRDEILDERDQTQRRQMGKLRGSSNHHMQLQHLIHTLQQEHINSTRHRLGICRAPYGAVNSVAVVPCMTEIISEGSSRGAENAVKLKVVSAGERGFVWLW